MPMFVRATTSGLSRSRLTHRISDDDFSLLEHTWHLRDLEATYASRIAEILSETKPFLPDFNGTLLASARAYNELDLSIAVTEFTELRLANLCSYISLEPQKLRRTGELENVGPVSIETLMYKLKEHDEEHRDQMTMALKELKRDPQRSSVES